MNFSTLFQWLLHAFPITSASTASAWVSPQKDVACLLGVQSSAKVSRYERFERVAGLQTALDCEVIFQVSLRDLFDGLYAEAQEKVRLRAQALLDQTNGRSNPRKQKAVLAIINQP